MKNSPEKVQKHCAMAKESIYMNSQLQQALAQIEAAISRKENQKVRQKSQNL